MYYICRTLSIKKYTQVCQKLIGTPNLFVNHDMYVYRHKSALYWMLKRYKVSNKLVKNSFTSSMPNRCVQVKLNAASNSSIVDVTQEPVKNERDLEATKIEKDLRADTKFPHAYENTILTPKRTSNPIEVKRLPEELQKMKDKHQFDAEFKVHYN